MHKIRVAFWRDDHNGPMQVVSGPIGLEKIHYQAPPAKRLANEMNKFFRWWGKSLAEMDGLLRAAVGHLWFVAIHPFEDGNGRIARTLNSYCKATFNPVVRSNISMTLLIKSLISGVIGTGLFCSKVYIVHIL